MAALRVALLIETSRQLGRELLRGVMRYHVEHGPWELSFEPRGYKEVAPNWLHDWEGDGIIARIHDRRFARVLKRKGVPLVDVRGRFTDLNVPALTIDSRDVVRMALQHLSQLGLRRFAYVGVPRGQDPWLDERQAEFRRQLDAAGLPYHLFESNGGIIDDQLCNERTAIAAWLKTVPRPVGIMAYTDNRGKQVLDACRLVGIRVPEEAAVIGVDDDEFFCDLLTPTLTSIRWNSRDMGYRAAEVLHRLMQGKRADTKLMRLRAQSLVLRRSTDYCSTDDPLVDHVLRYIREHACEAIGVRHVLRQVEASRRTVEQRFLKTVGRTLNDEIIRVRVERGKQLLSGTRLSIEEIAAKAGIATASHFSNLFKRETGQAPGEYRKQCQK